MDLEILTDAQLVELGCALRGGTFGKDPARMSKAAKMAYIRDLAAPDVIDGVIGDMLAGGERLSPRAAHVATAGNGRVTARSEASERLAEALREIVGNVPAPSAPIDEARVREITTAAVDERIAGITDSATTAAAAVVQMSVDAMVGRVAAEMTSVADEQEERIVARVLEQVSGTAPATPIDLSAIGGLPEVTLEDKHPLFELVLRLVSLPTKVRPNVLLVGPAGCGKSTLARQIAAALERPFCAISLSAGVSESALTCRVLPIHDGGKFGAVDSEFLRLYEQASVVLLDELDAADPNVLLVANAAISNHHFCVEARAVDARPVWIERHDDNVVMAAANTYGTGATAQYVGRGALDVATLDRFIIIEMGYDAALERRIMGVADEFPAHNPRWVPSASTQKEHVRADLEALHAWIVGARAKVQQAGLQRILSTRALQKAVALRAIGCSIAETQDRLLTGWREDERTAIGVAKATFTEDDIVASRQGRMATVRCPKCTAAMVERTRNRDGKAFLGCVNFPACNGTREAV